MTSEVRYCRGCNESYPAAESDSGRCPLCGLTLTLLEPAPALDLAATADLDQAAPQPAESEWSDTLVGRHFDCYSIDSFLGKGGMAWVFHAMHDNLHRPCAIKVLPPDRLGRNANLLELFLAEARAAASVVHPHIVTVHNVGQTPDFHYIELEFVPGKSLQQIVQTEGRLEPCRATDLLAQSCAALAEAHRSGLVHRDFKPSNILVHQNGLAKLADFGLAKRLAAAASGDTLAGTPYFMAPELFQGVPASARSDVYAVGVSYYYLLTGEFPFVERTVSLLAEKHAFHPIPDPRVRRPNLPGEAVELLTRCLAKRPEERPADGAEIYGDLRAMSRAMRSLPSLVEEALAGQALTPESDDQRIAIRVPMSNGRSQTVHIEECISPVGTEHVVKIYSLCCRAHEAYYRRALELNATIAHGSLAIEQVRGEPCFIMVNSYPRRTCDPEEIRHSVREIAHWADEIERALTGSDRY